MENNVMPGRIGKISERVSFANLLLCILWHVGLLCESDAVLWTVVAGVLVSFVLTVYCWVNVKKIEGGKFRKKVVINIWIQVAFSALYAIMFLMVL